MQHKLYGQIKNHQHDSPWEKPYMESEVQTLVCR